jgi:signal transduction histidine kinase
VLSLRPISCVYIPALISVFLSISAHTQTLNSSQLDSMEMRLRKEPNDSIRGRIYNELANHFLYTDRTRALQLVSTGLKEAELHTLHFGKSELLNTKATLYDLEGNRDSAAICFKESLALSRAHGFQKMQVLTLNSLGLFHWSGSAFDEALRYFHEALAKNDSLFPERKESSANYISNIGLIYQELGANEKAISFHTQALTIRQSLGLRMGEAISHANLGVCYLQQKNNTQAEYHFLEAIRRAEETGNTWMYHALHDNLGMVYMNTGKHREAIAAFELALNRPPELNANPKSDLSTYTNLASVHNTIRQPAKALEYVLRGEAILADHPELLNFSDGLHLAAAESRFITGDLSGAKKSMERYKTAVKAIFSEENAKALADMEEKYASAKKDKELLSLQELIQRKQLEAQRRTTSLVLLLAGILILTGVLYYLYRMKRNAAQQAQLELRLAQEKEVSRMQEERLRISRELHDNIGTYLTAVSAGVESLAQSHHEATPQIAGLQHHLTMGMRELRKTVWLLNKQSITLEEIAIRLRDLFKPFQDGGIRVQTEVSGNTGCTLNEIRTTHLLRIVQEATANAYRHSQCTAIHIHLKEEQGNVAFSIQDNGKGFSEEEIAHGNGLNNMRARMNELNGELIIESNPAQGTVVSGTFRVASE